MLARVLLNLGGTNTVAGRRSTGRPGRDQICRRSVYDRPVDKSNFAILSLCVLFFVRLLFVARTCMRDYQDLTVKAGNTRQITSPTMSI